MSAVTDFADAVFINGRVTTLNRSNPQAEGLAIKGGLILAVGTDVEVQRYTGPSTKVVDLDGRRVIPGLNDSHTHLIRAGLNYNMELRWDGVPTLTDAMAMLREQVQRTPAPQWVRVVGGFSEFQFAEKRLPTLAEVNASAPETPVFILHLYDRALLNAAALRAVGYTRETPDPPGAQIQRDGRGEPTGLLIAKPNAMVLYATLARGPRLDPDDQLNSTRHCMRELNRLGITSVIDAGGGFQNYPDDYTIVRKLHQAGELTVRIAYNLFTQRPTQEKDDFLQWAKLVKPGDGDAFLRHNGAGEMLVFSAADFEDFREPRPELATTMEDELFGVVKVLATNRWPFRIHATYDESITRVLDVYERVNREVPFDGLHWIIDHAETISERNIDRVKALGGGIAVQHRMAYQGEYFLERYGQAATERTPPVKTMLQAGVPVGMGTDATRVASYNPWVGLHWLVSGETVGGTRLYPQRNLLDRETALRLYTEGSAWFSSEDGHKGVLEEGQYADFAALSDDYLTVPESRIKDLTSVLTVVGGRVVHGDASFTSLAPPLPPPSPDWSPVGRYRRLAAARSHGAMQRQAAGCCSAPCGLHGHRHLFAALSAPPVADRSAFWGALGCACAFDQVGSRTMRVNPLQGANSIATAKQTGLVGPRLLVAGICLPFIYSGVSKLLDFSAAVTEFAGLGLPMPAAAAALTITVQLAGSALLALGQQRWAVVGAVLLAAFTAVATLIAHAFWTFEGPARASQANVFVEHVALVCALVFAGWWKWRAAGEGA